MVNTKTKFPRGILDRVISLRAHDGGRERALDPGLKLPSFQAIEPKVQARKPRVQASSQSSQAPVSLNQGTSGPSPCPGNKQQE